MGGKFFLVFLVTICFVQVFEARSLEPESRSVIDKIKELIGKLQQAISDIITNIPNLIKDLEEKIHDIISKLDIFGIVPIIEAKVEEILTAAGVGIEVAKECIEKEKSEVNALIKEATDEVAACQKVAEEKKEVLHKEMEDLKDKATATVKEVNDGVKQCVHDHGLNPIQFVKCMTSHFAAIKEKTDALILQIANTIATANKTALGITLNLGKCVATINTKLLVGQKNIIVNFTKCINDLKP